MRVAAMFDLPDDAADLAGLDLLFISSGGICWAPDIEAWERIVARRLLPPGGVALISEHQPYGKSSPWWAKLVDRAG